MGIILAADGHTAAAPSLVEKILKAGGIVGLIAFVLVIWLMVSVSGEHARFAEHQDRTEAAIDAHVAAEAIDGRVQRQLLKAICLNTARSPEARALCEVGQ